MRTALVSLLTMLTAFAAGAAKPARDRVIIDVDLTKSVVRVTKYHGKTKATSIADQALPVVPGSIKRGWYRSRAGRVNNLENAIFFGKMRTIRTTSHFAEMRAAGRPVAGSVVLPPDFGGLVFSALTRSGEALVRVH